MNPDTADLDADTERGLDAVDLGANPERDLDAVDLGGDAERDLDAVHLDRDAERDRVLGLAAMAPLDRIPRPPRFRRLRHSWLPPQWRDARVVPSRSALAVLVAVAIVSALVAGLLLWSSRSGTTTAVVPVALPVVVESNATGIAAASDTVGFASASGTAAPTQIVVSVTGAVNAPGVVTLAAGSRVIDAIEAAGGVVTGTDLTGLNLAARLVDADSVVVGGPAPGVQSDGAAGVAGAGGPAASAASLVNLNTADQTNLESLPGVGPVMAANIIDYRTRNGPFTAIDQLLDIPGIGPARYATLSTLVTL